MDIALLHVLNCKFDIIINRTHCNYLTWLLYIYIYQVACSKLATLYFTISSFINMSVQEMVKVTNVVPSTFASEFDTRKALY